MICIAYNKYSTDALPVAYHCSSVSFQTLYNALRSDLPDTNGFVLGSLEAVDKLHEYHNKYWYGAGRTINCELL